MSKYLISATITLSAHSPQHAQRILKEILDNGPMNILDVVEVDDSPEPPYAYCENYDPAPAHYTGRPVA